MSREVPRLSTIVLKEIAKSPQKHLSLESYKRAKLIIPSTDLAILIHYKDLDLTQILVDYIAEAGRLVDDVIPIEFFHKDRKQITLKNTKLSPKYLIRVLSQCPLLEVNTNL